MSRLNSRKKIAALGAVVIGAGLFVGLTQMPGANANEASSRCTGLPNQTYVGGSGTVRSCNGTGPNKRVGDAVIAGNRNNVAANNRTLLRNAVNSPSNSGSRGEVRRQAERAADKARSATANSGSKARPERTGGLTTSASR